MTELEIPVDASRLHTWTAIWGKAETPNGCEDITPGHIQQAPDYPLFLMLDLFEIGPPTGTHPKTTALRLRGWTS